MRRMREKRSVKRKKTAVCCHERREKPSADFFESSELDQTLQETDSWLKQEMEGDVPPLSEEETYALLKRVTDRINAGEERQTDAFRKEGRQETAAASKADNGEASGASDRADRSERRQKPRGRAWRLTVGTAAVLICLPVLLTVVYIGLPAAESDSSIKQDGNFVEDSNNGDQDDDCMPEAPMEPSDEPEYGWENLLGALLIQIGEGIGEDSYAGEGGQRNEGVQTGEGDPLGGEGSQADEDGFEAKAITGYGSALLQGLENESVRLSWTGEQAPPLMEEGQLWLVFVLHPTDEGFLILSEQSVRVDDFSADMPQVPLIASLCEGTGSAYPASADELLALLDKLS